MGKLKSIIPNAIEILSKQHFDSLAVGLIDFKKNSFESFEISATNIVSERPYLFFDLASVTKPLVNSSVYLKYPEYFDEKMLLLLNHKAGLPSGGLLSKKDWKDFILSYDIKKSETLYSDYSSLRCMLEIEKKSGKKIKELCSYFYDKDLLYWLDLKENQFSPDYGLRNKKIISGEVHDNNCFNLKEFVSHAGLFATVDGLCQTLLNWNKEVDLLKKLEKAFGNQDSNDRFILGFDRVTDLENTLAGKGCSEKTFGHLGFVGTSFWIDIEKMQGNVILSNGVQSYWYDKTGLNDLRRSIGTLLWKLNNG